MIKKIEESAKPKMYVWRCKAMLDYLRNMIRDNRSLDEMIDVIENYKKFLGEVND